MNTLHLMVGLPRAGKSTRSKHLARKHGWPIVNGDSVRKALGTYPFERLAEPMVWAIMRYMVRALFHAGHTNVIVDSTSHTREKRARWDPEDEPWNEISYELVDTPVDECIRRAIITDQPYLVPVIERMAEELTWPDYDE